MKKQSDVGRDGDWNIQNILFQKMSALLHRNNAKKGRSIFSIQNGSIVAI